MSSDKKMGEFLGRLLTTYLGKFPRHEEITDLLRNGKLDDASVKLRESLDQHGPVTGLTRAVEREFPGMDISGVYRAMERAQYDLVVQGICQLTRGSPTTPPPAAPVIPLAQASSFYARDPLVVAQELCGSVVEYVPQGRRNAVRYIFSNVAAFRRVGGADQSVPQSDPGTIGTWHGSGRGGYDVALISAHEPGLAGALAVWGVRPFESGVAGRELTGKTAIAQELGFLGDARCVGKSIEDSAVPLTVTVRASPTISAGRSYQVVADKQGNGEMVGSYKLTQI